MLYKDYLKKNHPCPFCNLVKEEIIRQNKNAILTLAKAPYTKNHLLVVPKKHCLQLNSMTKSEKEDCEKLIYYAMKKLHKKHKNVTVLYREGNKKEVGKSVSHVHYHLIPDMQIGAKGDCWKNRKIYSDRNYVKRIKDFKKRF